jgi:hypothetical protein
MTSSTHPSLAASVKESEDLRARAHARLAEDLLADFIITARPSDEVISAAVVFRLREIRDELKGIRRALERS